MSIDPLLSEHDALGLASLVRAGEVKSAELVEACIARATRLNPELNAIVTPMYDRAREEARGDLPDGPFRGVPFFVKDLVQPVAGVRFTRGSRFFEGDVARHDSTLIRRYRAAGLVIVGKTNTPELGLTPFTEPVLHGACKNPWDPSRSTGGSSGGAGAVVAARIAPMAHGGDGGGSIRIPASACGVFGMKPTRGRTAVGPDHSEGWGGLAVDHALTLSVRDSAALLDATCALEVGAPYAAPAPVRSFLEATRTPPGKLRIGVCRDPHLPSDPHPDVLAALDDAAALCRDLGHEVDAIRLPIDPEAFAVDFTTLVATSTAADVDEAGALLGKRPTHRDFETGTWVVAMLGRTFSGPALEAARCRLQAMSRKVAEVQERWDVILTPTLGAPPPRHGELQPKGAEAKMQEVIARAHLEPILRIEPLVRAIAKKTFAFIPYTPLANAAGLPSMSVPLHWSRDGMPIGSMFTGRFGDEVTLFSLAAQLEAARPWRGRRPRVAA